MAKSVSKTEDGHGLRGDWHQLIGHFVEVWSLGEHILTGIVQQQAVNDGSVLWIAAGGSRSRRLFDRSSGYRIWIATKAITPRS